VLPGQPDTLEIINLDLQTDQAGHPVCTLGISEVVFANHLILTNV
jgi:hypothetical protein